jgi:biotin carboxyl carrier protein
MKKFNITVNGKSYEVDVEEIGGASYNAPVARQVTQAAPAPQVAQAAPAAPAPKAAPVTQEAVAGGETTFSPMPGTILDIKVQEGDSVKSGQVLLILEAMKMENEIMAARDGKVLAIQVSKGASVNAGEALIVIG